MYSVPKSAESRIPTLRAPFPSFKIIRSWLHVGWLSTDFLHHLPLMKDPFHQGKWHRGRTIFSETLTELTL